MAVVHKKGSPLFDQAINYGLGGVACLAISFFMVYSRSDVLHVIGIAFFFLGGYLFSQCSRRCSGSLMGKLIASLEKCQEGSAMTLDEFTEKTKALQKRFA